jgi:hypothetical protein
MMRNLSKDGQSMLNLYQKRSLGITLGIVEDELRRLQSLIHIGEQRNLFSQITDDLKAEEKPLLQAKIEGLMDDLLSLKEVFDLRHSQKDLSLRAMVKAMAVYIQVELENVMSNRLKGYGEVNPGLKETLDPKLGEMITILGQMESIK